MDVNKLTIAENQINSVNTAKGKGEVRNESSLSIFAGKIEEQEGKIERANTLSDVREKANSLTSGKTDNHAEFVAGIMSPSLISGAENAGIDINKEDVKTVETVVDKIQMEMIKGGSEAVAMTANLSKEQLEQVSGKVATAYEMAANLKPVTAEEATYIVRNELDPTIGNLYQAENLVGTGDSLGIAESFNKTVELDESLMAQVQEMLASFQPEYTEEDIDIAAMMVKNDVALVEYNFNLTRDLMELSLPLSEDQVTEAVNSAMAIGLSPVEAAVDPEYSYENRAMKMSLKLIHNERVMEESRLTMTVQANLNLLKQGIHIETEDLEVLVEKLKEEETKIQQNLYKTDDIAALPEMDEQFTDTMEALEAFKTAPLVFLPRVDFAESLTAVKENVLDSKEMADFKKANEIYDTMRTQVMGEYGDSIQKAFRNVDDILEEMNLEPNVVNERAVRILAYNQTEITIENINMMKESDAKVQTLFQNLTPKVALSMIREGYNPLDVSLDELTKEAASRREELDPAGTDRFAKFLVQLDNHKEITPEEREGYLGIYRLLTQVEKSDGAAVGAVVLSGEDMTLRNLMREVRTFRSHGVDRKVDDNTGMMSEDYVADLSITEQIEASYNTSVIKQALEYVSVEGLKQVSVELSPENEGQLSESLLDLSPEELLEGLRLTEQEGNEYQAEIERFKEGQQVLNSHREVETFLESLDLPLSTENIEAAFELMDAPNNLYKNLYRRLQSQGQGRSHADTMAEIHSIKEDILEKFAENVKAPAELAEALENLQEEATHVMESMIDEDVTSLDLREMRLACQELSIVGEQAKKEDFALPVLVTDEMGTVSLKIVRGKKDKGKVTLTSDLPKYGKMAAEFTVSDSGIKGYAVAENQETLDFLKGKLSEKEMFKSMDYLENRSLDLEVFRSNAEKGIEINPDEDPYNENGSKTVKTSMLYDLARGFLMAIQ